MTILAKLDAQPGALLSADAKIRKAD